MLLTLLELIFILVVLKRAHALDTGYATMQKSLEHDQHGTGTREHDTQKQNNCERARFPTKRCSEADWCSKNGSVLEASGRRQARAAGAIVADQSSIIPRMFPYQCCNSLDLVESAIWSHIPTRWQPQAATCVHAWWMS